MNKLKIRGEKYPDPDDTKYGGELWLCPHCGRCYAIDDPRIIDDWTCPKCGEVLIHDNGS